MKNHFKGKQYDYRIIIEAVGLYYHFSLSYRDCAKIMRQFSINVHYTTIYRWCQQYGKVLYHLWKKRNKRRKLSKSWRMDETYVKVKGKDRYLYRAIDSNGNTLDMWLRNHRDTVSTKAFIKRLLRDYGQPRSIVTDKYAPSLKAIKELKEDGLLDKKVHHWKSKYLNNILEQDHRQVKGKLPYGNSFQSTYTAATTIKGIEVVSALYKESRREISLFDFSPWEEIENLLKTA
ncbi:MULTISPECIES: IS6 family transposase [Enterococcus]|uniref:IS6 family transposase n=1 Tax=Enterococcus dongliensis TaxID=2559925 RepID=A0ABU3ET09_9ENTE|nr:MULTISPECIES: IS6 family transposase [Enterococcus]EGO2616431.1 IS6 family transposase [Enterococcus faecalis]EGO2621798.1 IS6 family transposase [Enterococcus faecalis]MDT2598003.1 IS6 family transposase [Enterococcus dongliensis]